jgi:hypothetical protein
MGENALNEAWKSTCRIVLKAEVGELGAFSPYLLEMVQKPIMRRSALSDKEVYFSSPNYDSGAGAIALGEEREGKFQLDINQIKDIDSIISALSGQQYCGNKIIGNSLNISKCDACTDCQNALESSQIMQDKNIAYGYALRKNENCFGCCWCGEISFSIRAQGSFFSQRLFESYLCMRSSDQYFCMNNRDCANCLFSFNQAAKSNMIGNVQLDSGKFSKLKAKLISEMAGMLASKKRLPSLFEIVGETNG